MVFTMSEMSRLSQSDKWSEEDIYFISSRDNEKCLANKSFQYVSIDVYFLAIKNLAVYLFVLILLYLASSCAMFKT